jgi:hypothetical protein
MIINYIPVIIYIFPYIYFSQILFYSFFINHMHFLPVLYICIEEEVSFSKFII